MYLNRDKLKTVTITTTTTKKTIKVKPTTSVDTPAKNTQTTKTPSKTVSKTPTTPKVTVENSGYSFNTALNLQMRWSPQINIGWGWYNASRAQTSKAMNPITIWKS